MIDSNIANNAARIISFQHRGCPERAAFYVIAQTNIVLKKVEVIEHAGSTCRRFEQNLFRDVICLRLVMEISHVASVHNRRR